MKQNADLVVGARKDDEFDTALQIFQANKGHRIALLGDDLTYPGNDAGQSHPLAVHGLVNLTAEIDSICQSVQDLLQGMFGKVKAHQLLFPVQHFLAGRIRNGRQFDSSCHRWTVTKEIEHADLTHVASAMHLLADAHHLVHGDQQSCPSTKAIQAAHFDETFECPPVDAAQVHPLAKVVQALKRLTCFPCFDDRLNWPGSHILDRA